MVVRLILPASIATFALIAIPIWLHVPFAGSWGIAVAILAILFGWSGLVALLLARRSATRAMGIKITAKNSPPGDRNAYLQWCHRNGIEPFGRERRRAKEVRP